MFKMIADIIDVNHVFIYFILRVCLVEQWTLLWLGITRTNWFHRRFMSDLEL